MDENELRYMYIFDLIFFSAKEKNHKSKRIYVQKDFERRDCWYICAGSICINKYLGRDRYLTSLAGKGHTEIEVLQGIGRIAKQKKCEVKLEHEAYYNGCREKGLTLSITFP